MSFSEWMQRFRSQIDVAYRANLAMLGMTAREIPKARFCREEFQRFLKGEVHYDERN